MGGQVRKVSAWACATCGNVFRSTHHAPTKNGRVLAERCCTCSVEGCGRPTGRYIGGRGECELHLAEKNYARAVEQAEGAAEWLTKAKARLAAAKARSERASRRDGGPQ